MKKLIVLFVLLFNLNGFIFAKNINSSSIDIQINSKINLFMKTQDIPGAAVLFYHNGNLHEYYYGYSNIKKKTAINKNTLFELGSITKTFIGLLLAKQVNNGSIQLDDKLVNYLSKNDEYSESIKEITLLNLATHTASLPKDIHNLSYNAENTTFNKQKLTNFLENWNASYQTGTRTFYSNIGFSLLAQSLANNAKLSLSELMQKEIFQPLLMKTTKLTINEEEIPYYSQGYSAQGNPTRTPSEGLLGGAWALKASPQDMSLYLEAALCAPGFPTNIISAMKVAQSTYIKRSDSPYATGLGWFITPLENLGKDKINLFSAPAHHKNIPHDVEKVKDPKYIPNSLIDKTGATNGFRAYIGLIPDNHVGIVVLINRFIFDSGALPNMARKILIDFSGKSL